MLVPVSVTISTEHPPTGQREVSFSQGLFFFSKIVHHVQGTAADFRKRH